MFRRWIALVSLAAAAMAVPPGAPAEAAAVAPHLTAQAKDFVTAYYKPYFNAEIEAKDPTRVNWAELPLSDGRKDIIVYVTGGGFCGSGGCSMLVLEPNAGSFEIIARTTVTRTPIRLLPTQSHGHPDIAVRVEGGGITPGYEARLRFDGKTYPSNPTMPPAVPMKTGGVGQILIDQASGERLYSQP